jgi:hypothetical protein
MSIEGFSSETSEITSTKQKHGLSIIFLVNALRAIIFFLIFFYLY